MKKKLINAKNYAPACINCLNGKQTPDGTMIMCSKKGLTAPDFKCRSYKYDPLKRTPRKAPEPESVDPADFEL